MRRQIRRGVFETNSSSTHSITIPKRPSGRAPSDLPVSSDDYIHVRLGEFGWQFEDYPNQIDKLSYLLTMAWEKCDGRGPVWHDDEALARGIATFMASDEFRHISDTVCAYVRQTTGLPCHGILIEPFDGYIDHQSHEEYLNARNFLYQKGTTVLDFVFDPSVVLHTGNDNGSDWNDWY